MAERIKLTRFVKQSVIHHTINPAINTFIEHLAWEGQPEFTDMKGARFRSMRVERRERTTGSKAYFESMKYAFVVMMIYSIIVNGVKFT